MAQANRGLSIKFNQSRKHFVIIHESKHRSCAQELLGNVGYMI